MKKIINLILTMMKYIMINKSNNKFHLETLIILFLENHLIQINIF